MTAPLLLGALVYLLGGLAWGSQESLPFPIAPAEIRVLPREETFHAVLEAAQQSTVAAQTSGRVVEISFDVNDYVAKGQTILRIDDTTQRAQLQAAQADLREAQAKAKEAEADYGRIKALYDKRQVSRAQFDQITAQNKSARARLEAAEARQKQAEQQLDYTIVRAPYSGIVTRRQVEVGEAVNPGQPLMTGFSLEAMRAAASVPQEWVETVRTRQRARVVLTAAGGRSVEATRLTVFPFADPVAHTFTVRAELPPGEQGIYPGMFAKVVFEVGEEKRLLVPARALVYRSEVTGVYVVEKDGRVALRQVRVGNLRDGDMIEVLAGLEEGEQVALDPIRAGVYLKQQAGGRRGG
jgi:RND family efflux transporter MFP subunit